MKTDPTKHIAKWRAQFNPLRGLTFQQAVSLLEQGERGAYADLQWLYRFIEKRDATVRALKRLRLSAIVKLDWDIKKVDCGEDAARQAIATKQAAALRAAYERIDNLKAAISFLALAEFRGFAHLEKVYAGDQPANGVVHLEPVPQWHWVRDTLYGPWAYNAAAASVTHGEPVELQHFIVREVEDPIDEIALLAFLRKNLSQKDWDGFVETYGVPPLFATMPPNTPADKEGVYQAMAEAVVADMRGTLPNGADIKTVDAGARGTNPFRDHLSYQDEQVVLAGTSGKLTMLSSPTGIGSGPTDAHQDTFDSLAQAEAGEISELFQKQFDRAVLDAAGFGGQPALAYFQIAAADQADISQVFDHAVKASQAGVRISTKQLAEKTGYDLTEAPIAPPPGVGVSAFSLQPPGFRTVNRASSITPPADAFRAASLQRLGSSLAEDLQPARAALLAAIDEADDTKRAAALTKLRAELPSMLKGADSATASAFADILGTALVSGAASGREAASPDTTSTRNAQGIFARAFRYLFSR